ncbi:MAG TPA: hypothetical protein VF616_05405 [Duganella sp.]|uniref:hypothetical protein n=1 Tax=Duganella sp. TaxID=1904440 RepID=UPI002ED08208
MNSKTSTTKKVVLGVFVLLLAASVCQAVFGDGMTVNVDGDEIGGPFGALLGIVLGAGGMLLAALAMTCAAVFVGLVFAGVGVVLVSALVLAAVLLAAAISPLLLPLLIPVGLYWYFSARARKQRLRATMEHAV